ncbi:MAG: class I SAM-dependent methyltransferase [Magnetococcales bacterium]|nr:class I SAM-dependent methyltransferase [Magnetococcales bacterium]
MMFGSRETFDYWQCAACGLLWIAAIPDHLERYYGAGYYAHQNHQEKPLSALSARFKRVRSRFHLNRATPLARAPQIFHWLTPFGLSLESPILDFGCGTGGLLLKLRRAGFANLLGSDPFLPQPLTYDSGVRILAEPLEKIPGTFELIMLHHVLEHTPDQHATLAQVKERLQPKGGVLIRIPVANSYAHRRYGLHWMAWDAPRHLYLHTVASLHRLARRHSFEVFAMHCDARPENLLGCEYYQRDIPHCDWPETRGRPQESLFGAETRSALRTLTARLNATLDGDTACFYLRKM